MKTIKKMTKGSLRNTIRQMISDNKTLERATLPYRLYRPGKKYECYRDIDWEYNTLKGGKKYCLISISEPYVGLFEMWIALAQKARYAVSLGYIPFLFYNPEFRGAQSDVECRKIINSYENVYSSIFDQYDPDVSLNEILKDPEQSDIFYTYFKYGIWAIGGPGGFEKKLSAYRDMYKRMGVKKEIVKEAENQVIPPKTLGISVRRSMEHGNKQKESLYINWKGHHTRGHVEGYKEWIYKNLNKLGYDFFFLATEDRETVELLRKEFGQQCINYNRKLFHIFNKGMPVPRDSEEFYIEWKPNNGKLIDASEVRKEYTIETFLLSKCDAFLWNGGGQGYMASIMAKDPLKIIKNNLFLDMF